MKTSRKYVVSIIILLLLSTIAYFGKLYWDGQNSSMRRNSIALGQSDACFVDSEGQVYCWGHNRNMQLGSGDMLNNYPSPIQASAIVNGKVIAVATADGRTCVLVTKGIAGDTVQCWGVTNPSGTIIDYAGPPVVIPQIPEQVLNAPLIIGIVADAGRICAIRRTLLKDEILCWGSNESGEIGIGVIGDGTGKGYKIDYPVPTKNLDGRVVSLALGAHHTCAVIEKGNRDLFCWGNNIKGQLGNGTYADSSLPVKATEIVSQPKQVAAGNLHTCIITENETVQCWGANSWGQLGNGVITKAKITPQTVIGLSGRALSIKSSGDQTCALVKNGGATELYCWGLFYYPSKDGKKPTPHPIPEKMVSAAGGSILDYAVGPNNVCVVMKGNNVKCWGSNIWGQLGNGTFTDSAEPVEVKNLP